jgi:hypothetical protein
MKCNTLKIFIMVLSAIGLAGTLKAGPTVADVGDVDSFGKDAIYLGASSGFVRLRAACTPAPSPTASDQCVMLNPAPANTHYELTDICRIKLPKNSTNSMIYPLLTFFQNYQLRNLTGGPIDGLYDFTASLSIASDVLLDPSIIDPATGLPANGKLTFVFAPNQSQDSRTMAPGDRARNRLTWTRAGNAGISKANLVGGGTLTQKQADDLFKSSITVTMDVVGDATLVTDASITCNMRLMGDK